jgi:NitT/TauT family transport system ATP-binding protein
MALGQMYQDLSRPGAGGAAPTSTDARPRRGKLVFSGLSKRFNGAPMAALQDVSLHCQPGEVVVVVGPSGCGKTTLLNIAAGIVRPDRGSATLDGKPIVLPGPERAMVFQDHTLFPWLTARQNVEFGLKMTGVGAGERADRSMAALRLVHLEAAAKKLVHELSGGMRQRVAIARALVMQPAVLLMDEPFAALDAQTRTLLQRLLQLLLQQTPTTVLFVTHSVGEAARLANRIVVFKAHPGGIRREIPVQLPPLRGFDTPDVNELAKVVRKEIEDEVNRVNGESSGPEKVADLDTLAGDLGSGI